jgi:hypothetical protein
LGAGNKKLRIEILFNLLLQAGKSLYRWRGSTACAVVNLLKKWLFVQRNFFILFLRQPSPQLVDDCTCGTIPFPLFREFPGCKSFSLLGFTHTHKYFIYISLSLSLLSPNSFLETVYYMDCRLRNTSQGNLYTGEGDLPLMQWSIHLKSGYLCR